MAKVHWLEGLRGVAALQVVLLHVVTGLLQGAENRHPLQYHGAWEALLASGPAHVLYDGHTAVYVFFLISGVVLTPSFARGGTGYAARFLKRMVRLGLPVGAAACVAVVLLAAFPAAHLRAAELSGSTWLAMDSSGPATVAHLAREIGLDSLLLGYQEATLFQPWAPWLTPMAQSLDAPFWSLHMELYGSLLVLTLVTLRAWSRPAHLAAVVLSALAFGTHPMFLFVLGHLSVPLLRQRPRPVSITAGAALLAFGLAMSATKNSAPLEALRQFLTQTEIANAPNLFQFESQFAAVLIFAGVLLCPPVQTLLERGPCRHLGRLSFSIYLVHFPMLFTIGCLAFIPLAMTLPYPAAVDLTLVVFLALVFAVATVFERWVDRPAIALSRRIGPAWLAPA